MKSTNIRIAAISLSLAGQVAALDVHEWGTFTTFAGSSGQPLAWYLPFSDQAGLPEFVMRNPQRNKSSWALLRMETPVIYFYPEKEQAVTVEASFSQGSITESFPFPEPVRGLAAGSVRWAGSLHPPADADTLRLIPAVGSDHPLEPYAAARDVPDAWIFRSSQNSHPNHPQQSLHPQAEKFIFYRGAGQAVPEITASINDAGIIAIANHGPHRYPTNIALRVSGNLARWTELSSLQPRNAITGGPASASAGLSGADRPIDVVEAELAEWFEGKLERDGLTADEAKAMVATWRHTWFREDGVRVFSIMPREWIDGILPLTIEPPPESLVRVFVARLEILEPAKELALVSLITDQGAAKASPPGALRDLRLGRFAHGALERAIQLETARMRSRFANLQRQFQP